METLNFLWQGFDVATRPMNLLVALFGAFVGTVVGLLPGLGPINGVALLLPLAFALGLPPETALILLAAVYLGCEYGGRISESWFIKRAIKHSCANFFAQYFFWW